MKLLSRFTRALGTTAIAAAMACGSFVSCTTDLTPLQNQYDDLKNQYDDLKDQVDLIVEELFKLEQKLNSEIKALQDMLYGKILISDVSTNASTGITTVKLTNGSELTLYPQQSMKSYITYVEASVGGKLVPCWAYIDENGNKKLFKDENDMPIPVETDTPEVVVRDGDIYLVVGGNEYPLSGNSVFSDYELVTDPLTGEVYAVTFTFGEDMTFTVTVDGACGFHFVVASGWSSVVIDDYFVAEGLTERVQVDARGVVDYVLQIPDGWRVKEYEDIYMGTKYLDITAPSKELIASGIAAADGDLKVVAVLEGGKATVSKLYLSTNPFKEFGTSLGNATIRMYNGLQKYVYGFCTKAEYDESAIFAVAQDLLEAFDYPQGYGVSTDDMVSVPLSQILGSEPVPGEEYVLWAIPAIYWQTSQDAGYMLKEGMFTSQNVNYSSVKLEIGRETFRDVQMEMDLKGVAAYYTAVTRAEDYLLEDVLFCLNNGYYDAMTEPMSYTGSVFTFAGLEADPDTDYVMWIAVAEDGKTYKESDLIVREFSTLTLTAGGNTNVTAGEITATSRDVQTTLTASGAETIYYTFLTTSDAKKYADEQSRATYLFEKGAFVKAESVTVKASDILTSKLKPETSLVLMAVASDAEGLYGQVLYQECATGKIEYNNLQVEIGMLQNEPKDVQLSISTKGGAAAGYIYWIGKTSDNTWKSSNYLGGSAETAQVYMFLNPDHTRLTSVSEKYPVVNGVIKMTDLAYDTEYVIVAMAKDAQGGFSKATAFMFTPRALSLGNIVYATDAKWAQAKPQVEWIERKFMPATGMMQGSYACNITLPAGYTAYVTLSTDFALCESDVLYELEVDQKIMKVMQDADRKRDVDTPDPSIPADEYKNLMWPEGNLFYHYEHGAPIYGYAVIWANAEVHQAKCGCGKEGVTEGMAGGKPVEWNNVILYNDGNPIEFRQPAAIGSTQEVVDRVFIVCQDIEGNCYQTYEYDVPFELFANGGARDE